MVTKRRRTIKAADIRRAELLDAAIRVFARDGFDAPVSAITEEAGVAKGTFYLYFKTRDDLLYALRDRFNEHLAAEITRLRPPTEAGSWVAFLERLVKRAIALQVENHQLHGIVRRAPHATGDTHTQDPIRERLRLLLAEGVVAGGLDIRDSGATADLVYEVLHAAGDQATEQPDRVAAITRAAQDLVVRGLARSSANYPG
jgi:AcrR family transcriptional regulator